jgi:hypothetical protein
VSNQTISFQDLTVGSGVGSFVTSIGAGLGASVSKSDVGNGEGSSVVDMSLGLGVGLIDEGTKFELVPAAYMTRYVLMITQ